jgi:hypothetical protein
MVAQLLTGRKVFGTPEDALSSQWYLRKTLYKLLGPISSLQIRPAFGRHIRRLIREK